MIDEKTVEKVAKIARIELSEDEKKKFSKDMEDILSAFKKLEGADVSGVEPAFQPIETKDVLREDVEEPCMSQEDALANAVHKEDGFFKGPKAM